MSTSLAAGVQELSLGRFAEELASAAPAPGGSCAAALAGALAAGLVAMVARQTGAGDPFGDLGFAMDDVACEADALRAELLAHVDEDAAAFERLIAARRAGVETEELMRAHRAALEAPLRVARSASRVLELAAELAGRAHPHAAADARTAVLLAAASVEAAAEAEPGPVEDAAFRAARADELEAVRARARALRAAATRVRGPDRARAVARPV